MRCELQGGPHSLTEMFCMYPSPLPALSLSMPCLAQGASAHVDTAIAREQARRGDVGGGDAGAVVDVVVVEEERVFSDDEEEDGEEEALHYLPAVGDYAWLPDLDPVLPAS